MPNSRRASTARPASVPRSAAPTATIPERDTAAALADARRAAALCLDLKANEVVLLDLTPVSDATDYFVVASGSSDTHVRAIAEHVMEEMKKHGVRVHHVEGLTQGRWVLLDYVDFVVHVFHPALREFYQLERLWSDAESLPLESGDERG
jgi:ribosome-associated protein